MIVRKENLFIVTLKDKPVLWIRKAEGKSNVWKATSFVCWHMDGALAFLRDFGFTRCYDSDGGYYLFHGTEDEISSLLAENLDVFQKCMRNEVRHARSRYNKYAGEAFETRNGAVHPRYF